jgi:AcrR family transcriptional regulator
VDPALVLHYFGNKADLFGAAMRLPVVPSEMVDTLGQVDREHLGEAILRTLMALWDDPESAAIWLGLMRSAMADEKAAAMLKQFLTTAVFARIAPTLGYDDDTVAEYRLNLAASQILGLGLARLIFRLEPLASADTDELVTAVAPTLQHYLTGDLDGDTRPGT